MKNREIKFRAWTGVQMEYKVMVGYLGAFYVQGMDEKDSACMSPFNTKLLLETPVMQYTNLVDGKEKEIYDGDIVNWDGPLQNELMQVYWRNGAWYFKRFQTEKQHDWAAPDTTEIEVIGNIYENPELLN